MYAYVGVHACMHVAYVCKSCNQLGKDQLTRSLLRANVFLFLNRIMNLPDALLNDPSVPLYFLVRLRRLQRPLPSLLEAFCFLECFKVILRPCPRPGVPFWLMWSFWIHQETHRKRMHPDPSSTPLQ